MTGRSQMRTFKYGVTSYILDTRRIDGSWHIAMSRTLHIALCTSRRLSRNTKQRLARAFKLLFRVHAGLRLRLRRQDTNMYQMDIDRLLAAMVDIITPYSKSKCNSIKYHWPRHWVDTRKTLGCAAHEKSLERKIAETQKKNYKFTNQRESKEVENNRPLKPMCLVLMLITCNNCAPVNIPPFFFFVNKHSCSYRKGPCWTYS